MGSETGSSIIPILNQLEHAWTYKTPRGWLEVVDIGYKLELGEGRAEFPWIVSMQSKYIKITLYSLCLLKAIILLEEEEEIQVQKNVFQ
jgi:hypothetical protein